MARDRLGCWACVCRGASVITKLTSGFVSREWVATDSPELAARAASSRVVRHVGTLVFLILTATAVQNALRHGQACPGLLFR